MIGTSKLIDAIAELDASCAKLEDELTTAKEENQSFGNVLALIHRDGGHYITNHGHEKASKDAIQIVLDLRGELTTAKEENKRLREYIKMVGDYAYAQHGDVKADPHSELYQIATLCRAEQVEQALKGN